MVYERGETAIIQVTITDAADGTLTDPANTPTVSMNDAANGVIWTDEAMSQDSTGVYHKDYDILGTAAIGFWKAEITADNDTRITIQSLDFEVREAAIP